MFEQYFLKINCYVLYIYLEFLKVVIYILSMFIELNFDIVVDGYWE